MIALDTNVLVRLLTRDDELQAQKARRLLEQHGGQVPAFYVSDVVLAELAWTLERTYRLDRGSIGDAVRALTGNVSLGFDSHAVVQAALALFEGSRAGFADCLIIARAQAVPCASLATFDKTLRTLPGVRIL